jgi:hypothetical protein
MKWSFWLIGLVLLVGCSRRVVRIRQAQTALGV